MTRLRLLSDPRTVAERGGPWATSGGPLSATTRELARRLTGTLEVVLIWDAETNGLCVCVRDTADGDHFQLEVGPGEAMDAFHHPYAYAAVAAVADAATAPGR